MIKMNYKNKFRINQMKINLLKISMKMKKEFKFQNMQE